MDSWYWTKHKKIVFMMLFVLVGIFWVFFCMALDDDPQKNNSPQFAIGMLVLLIFWWGCTYFMVNDMSKKTAKYISKKIIAPTIVGVLLGVASFLITGEFITSGGITIIGSLITFGVSS